MKQSSLLQWIGFGVVMFSLGMASVGLVGWQLSSSAVEPVVESSLGEAQVAGAQVDAEEESTEVTNEMRIMAVGDVMLGRTVNTRMIRYNDVRWPFIETAELLGKADIAVANLESPILAGCPATDTGMLFCGRAEALKGVAWAGFDVLGVANNHSYDQGEEGLAETKRWVEQEGMLAVGGELVQQETQGVQLGWLAFNDVGDLLDVKTLTEQVAVAKQEVDVLVVLMHWGNEYEEMAHPRQVRFGQALVDAGADLILGAHPHVMQPVERYKDGLIFYSLGNFVFDQMWSEETRYGEVADITLVFKDGELVKTDYEMVPVMIEDYGQPKLVVRSQ